MLMNKEDIKKIIPHRDPFLLIDEVEEMEIGKSITAIKNVSADEGYFKGHFPGAPVMPGVLIVEALAQAGAVAMLSMPEYKGKIAFFGSCKEAKFRQKVLPGDRLKLVVELTQMRSRAGRGICKAYVSDKLACQCEVMFVIG